MQSQSKSQSHFFFKNRTKKKSSDLYGTTKDPKRPQIARARAILRKKEQSRRNHTTYFKLYYRAMRIRTAWYWQKNKHADQWNRTESSERKSHVYGQIIFDKGAKNTQWKKERLINKWCWENWKTPRKRMKLDYSLSSCTKSNSKWIKDLNIGLKIIR